MTNPTLITTPFAENGDKNIIPESVGAEPQNATMQAGFPPITQQKISEGGIPPERNDFNGMFNLVTQHLVHLNNGMSYEFDQEHADKIGGYPLNARLMLDNGDIVKSTVANNTANPNVDMTGWELANTSLNTSFATLNNAIRRVISDRFLERVSVKDFGAIGDGTLHTLEEWVVAGKFNNLAAIQMVMPFVTSLNQSIDWAVTQYCVLNAFNIFMPSGTYVFSDVVRTRHNTTPRDIGDRSSAVVIFGDGVKTKITRNDMRPATRTMNTEGTSTTQASDDANLAEACFSIHSPYTQISNMSFGSSAIGIVFGQHPDIAPTDSTLSSVAYSKIDSIAFENCGTGILMLATGGNHYVNFSNIHFTGCQIDLNQRGSFWWNITKARGDANNNRNTFLNIRSDRSRVGFWTECGDSNSLISWRGESMPSNLSSNPFPLPTNLPSDLTTNTLFVFTGSNQLNTISFAFAENVAQHLYNNGYENSFVATGLDESRIILKQKPSEWKGRFVSARRGVSVADNIFSAFPDSPIAGSLYLGDSIEGGTVLPNGVRVVTKDFWHQPKTNLRGSFEREFQIETGAISANTPVAFTIWGNVDASTSGMVELDIVGRCDVTGQTSTYIVKALANVYKASTRVPSRYSIHRILASRTTSQGIGDTTESSQISTTLQINPTVGQELQVVLSCPQALTSATIFVKQKAAK
uniref:Tail protein n=2 Tax=unclassified bacterial viruses TaxID=12333 RepID=A0AAU8KUW4_9VIRU